MKIIKFLLATTVISLVTVSCKTNKKEEKVEKTPGIVLENMDTSVKPSEDFYRYVNGKWQDKTTIPADRTSWGSFDKLRKDTDADVLNILEEAIKSHNFPKIKDSNGNKIDSDQEKAVNYFASIMDTDTRNKQGLEPIKYILTKIETIKTKKDVEKYLIDMDAYTGGAFYGFSVYNDLKNSKINAGYMNPGSLGLSRDYYVDNDTDTKEKLKKYESFVAKMFQKLGEDENTANKNASTIVALEKSLAKPRMSKEEKRDPRKRYNPMTVSELQKLAPAIDWNAYLKGIGVENIDKIIVTDPNYFKTMNTIFKNSSVNDLKTLFRWETINRAASLLSTDLEKANWEFYSQTLLGAKEQRPSKERALASANRSLGEAIGKLYVAKKFPPEAKKKAEEMIKNVRLGFEKRIAKLSWMSEETKKKAIEKLHKLTVKIAYPDKWKDYNSLEIKNSKNGGSYFENAMNVAKWNHDKNIKKLGKPVDRTEWGMSPQTVNAYFNPVNNEIVFPAAILQPPFYNYKADAPINYGGIGAVIGHEISHSFDDSGAKFDGDGNLKNWWTKEDAEKFSVAGKALIKQYSDLIAIDSVHVNGKFTLGENIGDLGGVQAAFEGLKIHLKNNPQKEIDGFTPEQRFFLSWATIWRIKMRPEALKNRIKTDPHAPGFFRAYIPLKNIDAFYEAFNIKKGDKMYLNPEERVKIW